jgi:hypothetical protein
VLARVTRAVHQVGITSAGDLLDVPVSGVEADVAA